MSGTPGRTISQVTWAMGLPGDGSTPPPANARGLRVIDVDPGTQIGGYTIENLIGRGGMGLVFKAYHERLQRVAAIKVLAHYDSSPEAIKRFEREAQTVARLRHPHIMTVFDFGEYAGQPYMVAEFMPNGSMQSQMPSGPATAADAIAVLRPLAAALDYAHEQGVIHRDVKPANVFLDAEFKPVLADFGLAKLHSDVDLTASGTVSGTPSYIAPEQATGAALTGATDRYSLAVMAFRLLSGHLPFKGTAVMDVLYAHVHTLPPRASSLNPDLPEAVDEVLQKGLAKDPAQRWSSCMDMVDALEAAIQGTLDVARLEPETPVLEAVARTESRLPAVARPRSRPRSRARLAAAIALTVILSGIAVAAALALQDSRLHKPQAVAHNSVASLAPGRSLELDASGPLVMGDTVTLTGRGFDPRSLANVGIPVDRTHIQELSSPVQVGTDGTFSITFMVPTNLKPGPAKLRACNVEGRDAATNCIDLPVTLAR